MRPDTLLYRQVHSSWVLEGRVTSQAFRPTPKDDKRLSVYDGDQITARDAFHHYTSVEGLPSVGVLAVTVENCQDQKLSVIPDPAPFQEHVLIGFTNLTGSQIRRAAQYLASAANSRGWLFRPES